MSLPAWPLGLARWADLLGRDLQRAARAAGGPAALWSADPEALARLLCVDGGRAEALVGVRAHLDAVGELARLRAAGIFHVGRPERVFPARLAEIHDPPFGLFLRGDPGALARMAEAPTIAVVGSRRATTAGLAFARTLAHDLAERGAVVVSGLAAGIDAAAHEGALDAGGVTIAVLGTGVDVVYPRRNRSLTERVLAEGGLLASEHWPGTPPAPWRFPARNRIVCGLSEAVVVVEAGRRSGALITADFALEAGRPVLAVPGPPVAESSAGCNGLIRAGAALCEGAEDVVAELPRAAWAPARPAGPVPPAGLAGRIYEHLLQEPLRIDQIATRLGAEPAAVAAALARLEIDGLALRGEGQCFWAAPRRGAA